MTRTYEELLASQTELAHFNPFHNPKNGQFAKKRGGDPSRKEAVKRYSKAYDRWSTEQDRLDEEWGRLEKEHKSLGKNKLSRAMAVAKGSSEAAKKYSKDYDKWSTEQDKNDARGKELKQLYKDTGNTYLSRILNNSNLSPRGKEIVKRAGTVAGVAAGVSALATVGNAVNAQKSLDALGFGDKLITSQVVKAGVKKAGAMALGGALATIGGHMIKDYMTKDNNQKKKSGE